MVYITTSKMEKIKRKEIEKILKKIAKRKRWVFEERGNKSISKICLRAFNLGEKEVWIVSKNRDKIYIRRIEITPYSFKWKNKKGKEIKIDQWAKI
ncbi:MAG: hypothetical protein ACP5HJ_01145 [Candidatus Micrarchaeia archaeon]|jgi:rRNA maturation protein Rpf1